MGYDEKTGVISKRDVRTASKYITYLSRVQENPVDAIRFIENNENTFSNEFVIIRQWFNIYYYNAWTESARTSGILKVANALASNVKKIDNNNEEYFVDDSFLRQANKKSKDTVINLLKELKKIAEKGDYGSLKRNQLKKEIPIEVLIDMISALENKMSLYLKYSKGLPGIPNKPTGNGYR